MAPFACITASLQHSINMAFQEFNHIQLIDLFAGLLQYMINKVFSSCNLSKKPIIVQSFSSCPFLNFNIYDANFVL